MVELPAWLMPPEETNWLIQALDALSAKCRQRGHRNVEKIEHIRDVQPDAPGVGVAHLEDLHVEQHFRTRAIELAQKLGCRLPTPVAAAPA